LLESVAEYFSSRFFMPHGHCYLWKPELLWLQVLSNGLIGASYVAISTTLAYLVFRIRDIPFKRMYLAFGIFIITCGITHFFDIYVVWTPAYWTDGVIRAITALASVGTALMLPPLVPKAVAIARGAKAAHDRGVKLETVVKDLATMYERTKELEQLKTQFFANVSHELRTPLALIVGPVDKLLAGPGLNQDQRHDLELVARNARSLLRQVNDLLEASKLEAGKMDLQYSRSDVARLVRVTAANFESLARERGIQFTVTTPPELPAALDNEKIHRVLLNLLSNAFKFTPAGGRIRCQVDRAADGKAVLAVADSGPGIKAEHREVVFERFRQLEGGLTRRFGGTGLGLAISRHFCRMMGGDIVVASVAGAGSTFTATLPAEVARPAELALP
jgi:signal transduction histidine kinase